MSSGATLRCILLRQMQRQNGVEDSEDSKSRMVLVYITYLLPGDKELHNRNLEVMAGQNRSKPLSHYSGFWFSEVQSCEQQFFDWTSGCDVTSLMSWSVEMPMQPNFITICPGSANTKPQLSLFLTQ